MIEHEALLAEHLFREETVNALLADMLAGRGLDANAETIVASAGKHLPDVLVSLDGVKLVIEGRFTTNTRVLYGDAKGRIEKSIADLSIALVYEPGLNRGENHEALRAKLEVATYVGVIYYVTLDGIAEQPFKVVGIDEFVKAINTVFGMRVRNDIIRSQVTMVQDVLDRAVTDALSDNLFFKSETVLVHLRAALGIRDDGS
jgi:hypothetical protein